MYQELLHQLDWLGSQVWWESLELVGDPAYQRLHCLVGSGTQIGPTNSPEISIHDVTEVALTEEIQSKHQVHQCSGDNTSGLTIGHKIELYRSQVQSPLPYKNKSFKFLFGKFQRNSSSLKHIFNSQ